MLKSRGCTQQIRSPWDLHLGCFLICWLFFSSLVFFVRLILQMSISHNEVEILFVDIVIATMLRCPGRKAVEEMLMPGARGSQQDDGARGSQQDDGARRWCRRGRNKMILMLKDQDLDLDTMS